MSKTLVLIDGTNYAFRAFHAIPLLTNSKGFPTNALHGYASMLVNFFKVEKPDYLAVAFDAHGPTFRKSQFDAYKAQRKETPSELIQQMPYFRKITEAFNIPFLELSGYEADDVIATIIRRTEGEDIKVRIISMDKDLMQLVDERVVQVDTLRNKTYDPPAVEEKWGVPPGRLRDLLALTGDTSDNIPGVPGIGPKKAKDLVMAFNSIPELLEKLDQVPNAKIREVLQANVDAARLSLELVTLHYDVPLEMPLESLRLREPDSAACRDLFRELEFKRYLKEFGDHAEAAPAIAATVVRDRAGLEALVAALAGAKMVAVKTAGEGSALAGECTSIALAVSPEQAWSVPLCGEDGVDMDAVREVLGPVLADPTVPKAGHDIKQDYIRLHRCGLPLAGIAGDLGIASYLLNPSRTSHDLGDLVRGFLELELQPSAACPGCAESQITFRLHELLEAQIEEAGMGALYRELELPLLSILGDMELLGIRVDCDRLKALSADFEKRIAEREASIMALAGEAFNPASPKQLQTILFEKLKLPVTKRTKTGPSTDQEVLEALAEEHALPAEILAYRSLTKLKNTYIDTLPKLVDKETSRVHTTFNQTVAATGRLSSSDPNLQNIPIRGEEGIKIRAAFIADPGWKLMAADYSQIELRLLAHFCEDETLIHAFTHGLDIHAATAADMFGVMLPLVTQQMRRSAKAINFGILYGMGAHRLARELKISRKEAEQYIARYFERYGRVKAFLEGTLEKARAQGYVTTLFQRRRYIPELSASNFNVRQGAERIAVNTPIQGSAADIIKVAMREIHRMLEREQLRTRLLLQVHDELVFEVPEDELERVGPLVKACMEGVVQLKIPLTVEVGVGNNWAEAH